MPDSSTNTQTNTRRALALFIGAMLIYGSIGVFRRHIPLSSAALACARGAIGGLFLWGFAALTRGTLRLGVEKKSIPPLALAGLVLGVNWMLLFEAYRYTTIAIATLCYAMQPVILIALSPLVFGEAITLKKAACVAVAVAGMALVAGIGGSAPISAADAKGIALGLGGALLYAVVVILNKKIHVPDMYGKTTVELLAAACTLFPYVLLTAGGEGSGAALGAGAIALVALLGVLHTGIAYAMYFSSLYELRAQSAAMLSYIEPVAALLLSIFLLHEPFSAAQLAGAALIIGAAAAHEWLAHG